MLPLVLVLGVATSGANAQRPVIQRIHDTANEKQDSVFRLGSTITLEVQGLSRWMETEEETLVKRGFDPQKAHQKAHSLVLYIDDAPLIGMPPLAVYADEARLPGTSAASPAPKMAHDSGTVAASPTDLPDDDPITPIDKVIFKLNRNPDNYQYWDVVYDSPWDFSHPGKIGLGYDDRVFTELYPAHEENVRLELIQPSSIWVAALGTGILALGILLLARKSWLLRDWEGKTVPSASTIFSPTGTVQPPYSLAKTQLAFWTFLIMSCFLIIYCVTGEMTTISVTTLALLGISAGTTGLSGLIGNKDGDMPTAAQSLPPSQGFMTDILSDERGVSVHRLQKVVITVLLGYFFARTVYKTVALPEWTNNETLLLALSSATYLGLKWQETKTEAATVNDPATLPAAVAAPAVLPAPATPPTTAAPPVVPPTFYPPTPAPTPAPSAVVATPASAAVDQVSTPAEEPTEYFSAKA
ncbi:hypothetical protein [Hymenobacter cavernae]|uniref:Uncharacterized protein n=1 Tax=Hymenobacter cavernae TaxID=2044852 RepID=A0ABQ1TXW2_9BACT|nr:hypothetical protein [Hymenobacter cavernae]GGF04290.1 hypothetical protein GCM10011383_14220 [Hymenobacter cavernae]